MQTEEQISEAKIRKGTLNQVIALLQNVASGKMTFEELQATIDECSLKPTRKQLRQREFETHRQQLASLASLEKTLIALTQSSVQASTMLAALEPFTDLGFQPALGRTKRTRLLTDRFEKARIQRAMFWRSEPMRGMSIQTPTSLSPSTLSRNQFLPLGLLLANEVLKEKLTLDDVPSDVHGAIQECIVARLRQSAKLVPTVIAQSIASVAVTVAQQPNVFEKFLPLRALWNDGIFLLGELQTSHWPIVLVAD